MVDEQREQVADRRLEEQEGRKRGGDPGAEQHHRIRERCRTATQPTASSGIQVLSRVNASSRWQPTQSSSQRDAPVEREDRGGERGDLERQPPAVREWVRRVADERLKEDRREGHHRRDRRL